MKHMYNYSYNRKYAGINTQIIVCVTNDIEI